ncbi:MAG: hydrogenase expression/formation protein HypE [Selenomonadaceae bacterium]|nr:hydrogenase expression/formation protein HypE [Selenomonadaceae bacterium]MBR1860099.1 hydrogenase expression/formation protein HypE [Selenomonadaceae bacterium]
MDDKITLAHGAGGQMSHRLMEEIILPAFDNSILNTLHDGALLNFNTHKLAFTTDSYVVRPLFFRGGDIGKIAVCGTVNDLAMSGAVPKYISVAFIIEEGFLISDLKKIVQSIRTAADEAKVKIVTGDTKVVAHGQCDGIFINTAGVGELIDGVNISPNSVKAGMKVIINGYIGDHAAAILAGRHNLNLPDSIKSDCAPLNDLVGQMLNIEPRIAVLRDPTRGGLAAVLNEIAQSSKVGIIIDEEAVPVRDEVRSVCDILGFDPLELANEGKLIAFVPDESVDKIIDVMRKNKYGTDSVVIGEVTDSAKGQVGLKTPIGSIRIVDMPLGNLVPRIC